MVDDNCDQSISGKIALISMPWAIFNRPSVQLGSLKAYTKKNTNLDVHTFHPYLILAKEIGQEEYHAISQKTWAGEALYSSLLFKDKYDDSKNLFERLLKKKHHPWADYQTLLKNVEATTINWLKSIDFSIYKLVGFSVCFDQLCASLFAARWIKENVPDVPIVFGGSACSKEIGQKLSEKFEQIDYVVDGEGEAALIDLYISLQNDIPPSLKSFSSPALDMTSLPVPDYDDYFNELVRVFPDRPFTAIIPVEFSRGCWWSKCTFCNLSLQWKGYRWKKAEQVALEVKSHCLDHNSLDFTFTDNALPPKEAQRFFTAVTQQEKDFSFFAEIRATNDNQTLELYRKGGLYSVQVGIEALSDSLLEKMHKGTTVIENISIMKSCATNNINLDGNLIIGFPTSTNAEAAETFENLDFVLPFNPLSTALFFLGHRSPIQQDSKKYNIRQTVHEKNKAIFPSELLKDQPFLALDYYGDKTFQKKNWQKVKEKVKHWQEFHKNRSSKQGSLLPLSYREGATFIIVRQELLDGSTLRHNLKGLSREIYLFCNTIKSVVELKKQFPQIGSVALINFLQDLHNKRILYFDGKKVLSLAIHQTL